MQPYNKPRFLHLITCLMMGFLFFSIGAFAQLDSWTKQNNLTMTVPRSGLSSFTINGKGYTGTGAVGNNFYKDFWEYDPSTDTWSQKANFGGTGRWGAVGFSIGNKGYIGTGTELPGHQGNNKKDFWEYDPTTNLWTQKADFGGTARQFASGFVLGSKGYIGTGYDVGFKKDFWEYNPTSNVWTQKADFGGAVRDGAASFSIGNKGYIGTGYDIGYKKDFWEYDPALDEWTQKADFGGLARFGTASFTIGNNGYMGAGQTPNRMTDFWAYDPATNVWTHKADFGGVGRVQPFCFSIGNNAFVGFGQDNSGAFPTDFWKYSADIGNVWTQQKPITQMAARSGLSTFSINGKGYMGTGANPVMYNDFWEYDPSSDSWAQKANFGGTARWGAVGFSIGAKGYIGTGTDLPGHQGGNKKDFWEYDPSSNLWTQKADFGGTARQFASGFTIGNKGYVGTGYDGVSFNPANYKKDFWEYDPSTNIWVQKADFGGTVRDIAASFSIGSKGYIGTGYDGGYKKDFWEYDPSSNIWMQKADFGGIARSGAACFNIGNKGFIGTGQNPNRMIDFWEYDPLSNVWTQKADFSGTGRVNAFGFSIGNNGYIGFGQANNGSFPNDFWKYTAGSTGSSGALNYRAYQGAWTTLPNFNALSPVKTGTSLNVDISARPSGVNDNFGFVWEGKINIPAPGTYTFETISDDGSRLYFNSSYSPTATPTVDNDGLHATKSATGSINIPAAGSYPVAITFFENSGGESMQVFWSGPGIPRQPIPDAAFISTADIIPPGTPANLHVVSKGGNFISLDWDDAFDNIGVTAYDVYVGGIKRYSSNESQITADSLSPNTSYTFTVKARDFAGNTSGASNPVTESTTNVPNGLNYRYYEGTWNVLPDFTTLTPVKTGNSLNVDISVRPQGRNDNFAFVWEGYINIQTPGNYTFETISDDGSKLYFNTLYSPSAIPIVNNDGLHGLTSSSGSVNISVAGSYPISITYFEKDGGESMQVFWSGPNFARVAIPNAAFTQGAQTLNLNYKYYEGDWNALPNFNLLTPVKSGSSQNVDINIRPAGKNDSFAIVWEGHINIPSAGIYTFETISDDGSRLYFNSLYAPSAIPTVDNDGLHAPRSVSATVNIAAPGSYPISFTFFEKGGGETMQVFWSGPGFSRQAIPDVAFGFSTNDSQAPTAPANLHALYSGRGFVHLDWDNSTDNVKVTSYDVYLGGVKKYSCTESAITADSLAPNTTYTFTVVAKDLAGNVSTLSNSATTTTSSTANGLRYRYFEGVWSSLPNFNELTPLKTGSVANIDLSVRNTGVNDHFAFVWEGYINIPTPGNYTFETISDDGSRFYFNSFYVPGVASLVNNDGLHAASPATGSVNIPAPGLYPVAITFFENDGGESMQVYWSGPGIPRQPIPNAAFIETIAPFTSPLELNSANGVKNKSASDTRNENIEISKIYPNPFYEKFNIDFYNNSDANDISVNIFDMNGRSVYNRHAGKLPAGNNSLSIQFNKPGFVQGTYVLTLTVNGQVSKTIKLVKTKNN